MQSRQKCEDKEKIILAPYASLSFQSRGRKYPEKSHLLRLEYQRDRDRVIHSTAFRRLEYKSQVVLNGTGDHFRTRLTHTMEVAAIARTTARALALNEDLTEAIALAHDLGHPPFGHPGEDILNRLMADHGGFEHNRQSFRIVDELEMKYPEFRGLNLTCETLDGIALGHKSSPSGGLQPSLEAQVTDLADEIAYCCHDLDDALDNGLLKVGQLQDVKLWKEISGEIYKNYPKISAEEHRRYAVRCIIDFLVGDLCQQSAQNLQDANPANAQEAQKLNRRLIAFNSETKKKIKQLHEFLYENFYSHPKVLQMKNRACEMLEELFKFYCAHPDEIGEKFLSRIQSDGVYRAVCDYVSGMTDRYALQCYAKHIGNTDWLKEFGLLI